MEHPSLLIPQGDTADVLSEGPQQVPTYPLQESISSVVHCFLLWV